MLGIIARADYSGLASQTLEMARHVHPDKVLVVHPTDADRGPCEPERFEEICDDVRVETTRRGVGLSDQALERWLDGLTHVYTAEGDYGSTLAQLCAGRRIRLAVHANPELWTEKYRGRTTTVVCPTDWEIQRVQDATVMPMPVDRQRLPYRHRTEAVTFWHPGAPAFHDRHGTAIVRAMVGYLTRYPIRLVISGTAEAGRSEQHGGLRVEWTGPRANYWDGYDEADVLVLPRRYAGLSLPVQEALSSGMPVVMLDTGPYAGRGGVLTVPVTGAYMASMKGGEYAVHTTDPNVLADELEDLYLSPETVRNASKAADETAEQLSWEHWTEPWRSLLGGH